MKEIYTLSEVADLLGKSKKTIRDWDNNGKLQAFREPMSNYRYYKKDQLSIFEELDFLFNDDAQMEIVPKKNYSVLELFAGAGGLALGLEKSGLHTVLLNEIDRYACETLRLNRPNWNILEGDIKEYSFKEYKNEIDVITGGFPCQAFSYAGKKLGLEDTRGTLFYEFARVVDEVQPKIFIAENVKGLLNHDNGKTLKTMVSIFEELGYQILDPKVLKAIFYNVPQKRERIFIVGISKEIKKKFYFPKPNTKIYTLRDALKKGDLFNCDVPISEGVKYPETKKKVLKLVPPGGCWRDLPLEIQKEYMKKSFYLSGGKTGMARKISWDEPCLTLTCSPAQKQTERCHPEEVRPFTIREYARIQTFPDNWKFAGSTYQQYKQIGNAVPVNLAKEIGYSIISFLNSIEELSTSKTKTIEVTV